MSLGIGALSQRPLSAEPGTNATVTLSGVSVTSAVGTPPSGANATLIAPYVGPLSLSASSPLIDAGIALPGYTDDAIGAAPDLGAAELKPEWAVQVTSALGTITVVTPASAGAGGVQVQSDVGSVTVTAGATVTPVGAALFGLQATSPLIDAGILVVGVNDDFAGIGPDIGAIETRSVGAVQIQSAIGTVTPAISNGATIASGVQATSAIGTVTVGAVANVTVSVGSVHATSAVGAIAGFSITEGATGVQVTGSIGMVTPSVSNGATVTLGGAAVASALGTLVVHVAETETPTGVQATSAIGTVSVSTTAGAAVALVGVATTSAIGIVSITTSNGAAVGIAGVVATSSIGAPAPHGAANLTIGGVSAQSAVGGTAEHAGDTITVTGVVATSALGTISVTTSAGSAISISGVAVASALGVPVVAAGAIVSPSGVVVVSAIGGGVEVVRVTLAGVQVQSAIGAVVASIPSTAISIPAGVLAVARVGVVAVQIVGGALPTYTTLAGLGLNTPLSPLWDAVKAQLATTRMLQILSGNGTVPAVAPIYLNTDDIPQKGGALNTPWGRLVILPTQPAWGNTDRVGETRRVSFLLRAEFNNFKATGYRVDYALDAVHTECLRVLQGTVPATSGLAVIFPLYRNTAPDQAPRWDQASATWYESAEWRCEVMEGTAIWVPAARIAVSPPTFTLGTGATQQLTATVYDANSSVLSGHAVTYESGDPSIATVSASGLVTAVGAGECAIIVGSDNATAASVATVTAAAPVAHVLISPTDFSLNIGATQQLTITTKDAQGNVLTGRAISYASTTPAHSTVNSTGLVTAVGAGASAIDVTSEGVTSAVAVETIDPYAAYTAFDSATRADSNTSLGTATEKGGAWTVLLGTGGVSSGTLVNKGTDLRAQLGSMPGGDGSMQADIGSADWTNNPAYLLFRIADVNNHLGMMVTTPTSGSIRYRIAGALTAFVTFNPGLTNGTPATFKVIASGATIIVLVNGVLKLATTLTGAALTVTGSPAGFEIPAASGTTTYIDNYKVGP